MLVLLTGSSGFIGMNILKSLSLKRVMVRLIVRSRPKDNILKKFNNIEKVIVTTDMFSEKQSWLEDSCKDVDTIIHAAWTSDPGANIQSSKNIDSMVGTIKLAEAALKSGVRRFVGLGSCYEYDTSNCKLSINSPINPKTIYGATKLATYLTLSQYFKSHGVEFIWNRIFFLYGEGESKRRLVAYVHQQLSSRQEVELSSGDQIRDYMDVKVAADKIVSFALSQKEGVVNICSGKAVTVRQLVEKIADEYDGRKFLKFGAKERSNTEPDFIVGVPTKRSNISKKYEHRK